MKELLLAAILTMSPFQAAQGPRLDDKPYVFTITNPADGANVSFACVRIIEE
jgi:hypothetical protein